MSNQFEGNPNIPTGELRADIPRIQTRTEAPGEGSEDVLWLDYQSGADAEGIKSDGVETYVISPITERDLFSDKYKDCTGVIGFGRDKVSGKEIVFLSHQDPDYFVNKGAVYSEKFGNDLRETLVELLERSDKDTVEVVIFGGKIDPTNTESKRSIDYGKSIDVLNTIIRGVTGRNPAIIHGPNPTEGAIDVNVSTQTRKVSIWV